MNSERESLFIPPEDLPFHQFHAESNDTDLTHSSSDSSVIIIHESFYNGIFESWY